jgi:hypothetical protein
MLHATPVARDSGRTYNIHYNKSRCPLRKAIYERARSTDDRTRLLQTDPPSIDRHDLANPPIALRHPYPGAVHPCSIMTKSP